jgi:hypothetical protein
VASQNEGAPGKALQIAQYARQGESLDLTYFQDNSDKFNTLVPFKTVQPLSPYHIVGLSIVRLNPDPNAGDVYKDTGTGQLRPAKVGLMKLSSGAGIQWVMEMCKILYLTDHRCGYQAVGFIIGPDGMPKPIKGTKDIDLLALEDEIRMQQETKLKDGIVEWSGPRGQRTSKTIPWKSEADYKAAVEQAVRKEMIGKRKNLVQLAETGAYLRAIRSSLALKSNYTAEELARPFVMTRTFLDPQADPDMVKEAVRASFRMTVDVPQVAPPPARALLEAPSLDLSGVPEGPDDDEPSDSGQSGEPEEAGEEAADFVDRPSEPVTDGEIDSGVVTPEPHASRLYAVRDRFFPGAEVSWNKDAKKREGHLKEANGQLGLHEYSEAQRLALYAAMHVVGTGEKLPLEGIEKACSVRCFVAVEAMGTPELKELREAADWWLARQGKGA